MEKAKGTGSAILAIIIMAIVVSTAYLAAGAVHNWIVPPEEDPVAVVSLVEIDTAGLGGAVEHPPVPAVWTSVGEYDLGVRVTGLRSEAGIVTKLSIAHDGISSDDVEVYYFDTVSNNWRLLVMQDRGNELVTALGLTGGIAMYEGYDHIHRLIIFSDIEGACQVRAWVEVS